MLGIDDNKRKNLTFAIIALGYLGDTLLNEPLCRNIKDNFPDSKIVFIANDLFVDVPKGFSSVDYVIGYDKKEKHSGLLGYFRFAKEFPLTNNIDFAILTHSHERSLFVAKAIGAKNIVSLPVKKCLFNGFITHKRAYIEQELRTTYKPNYNNGYISLVDSNVKVTSYFPNYVRDDFDYDSLRKRFCLPENYIVLSPTAKVVQRDWDYDNVKCFVEEVGKPVVIIGTGRALDFVKRLQTDNISVIDAANKTTIAEAAALIKMSDVCVSMDTGTFHLSYTQNVNTVGLFFDETQIPEWSPSVGYVKNIVGVKYKQGEDIVIEKNIFYKDVLEKVFEFGR